MRSYRFLYAFRILIGNVLPISSLCEFRSLRLILSGSLVICVEHISLIIKQLHNFVVQKICINFSSKRMRCVYTFLYPKQIKNIHQDQDVCDRCLTFMPEWCYFFFCTPLKTSRCSVTIRSLSNPNINICIPPMIRSVARMVSGMCSILFSHSSTM